MGKGMAETLRAGSAVQSRPIRLMGYLGTLGAVTLASVGCAIEGGETQSTPPSESSSAPSECPSVPVAPTGAPAKSPDGVSSLQVCFWKLQEVGLLEGGSLTYSQKIGNSETIARYWTAFQGLPEADLSARCPAPMGKQGLNRIDLHFTAGDTTKMLVQWFPEPWCNRGAVVNGQYTVGPGPELPVPSRAGK